MSQVVVPPLPQPTVDRLLTAIAEGYGLNPVEIVRVSKFLESWNVPSVVAFEIGPVPHDGTA